MLVPISWLKELVDLNLPVDDLAERLTLAGLEVASLQKVGDWWDAQTILVGQVIAVHPHPNADRLVLVDVDFGGDAPQQVVTGAPNLFQFKGQSVDAGDLPILKVAFARSGAVLVDAYSEETPRPKKELKPAKIRGVRSEGMVCSERELGLSEEHEGIMLLPENAPIGTPLRDYLGDTMVEIELTPDMARCLSMAGVAREVAALTGGALHLPADAWQPEGDDSAADYVEVAIENPEVCARYTAILIRDVTVGPSPAWLQDRLRKAGMRPISNIVDITNYVMLELGQPLHAFDYDLLLARAKTSGHAIPKIIVRTATPGEEMITIDHVKRTLDDSMLLITDTAGPIAIAGVMGGADTEVYEGTRNVLLESATFEGINNRRTSQKLKLHSEASHRFTRGVPATLNDIAARRAADFMRQLAGGRIVPGIVDAYPLPQPEVTVYTTESEVRRQLGMEINRTQIAHSLQRLDFGVTERSDLPTDVSATAVFGLHRAGDEPVLAATAPWHRLDIAVPADLTEEVARMVGYDKVGVTLLDTALPPQRRNFVLETEEQIRDILIGCGLMDTLNYTLTSPENHDKLRAAALGNAPKLPFVELENPPSVERRVMRRSLLVSALENLVYNSRFSNRLAFFEIGRVYRPEEGQGLLPKEDRRISIAVSGPRRPTNIHEDTAGVEPFDFFDIKGIIETLVRRMGYAEANLRFVAQPDTETFGPRCAEVWLGEERLGILGELHPRVRDAFGLGDRRVALAELHVTPFIRRGWQVEPLPPISVYQPVVEDLAFAVAEDVTVRRVQDSIKTHGGDLLADVELFDIYRGSAIPVGHKSLAFRVTYQSLTHGLGEKEINHLRETIIAGVEADTGGALRG
ncbi:MAG: phenylalanine--tRNA ligase subunit beta [Caldilineaceae bacterium]|nr:phenylalanine--tRNA ligase subunit beta [Caldilineaceae bacterium]